MVQVGETAVDQRTHEVHRHRRARVRLHHQPRVRRARLRIELRAVDDVAAVARQRRAAARFDVRRTRLRVLAGEAPDAHHRQAQPVHQHQAHLQQHLEPVADHVRRAFGEAFGAIAALQHEAPPFLRIRDLALQLEDFQTTSPAAAARAVRAARRPAHRRRDTAAVATPAARASCPAPALRQVHGTQVVLGQAHRRVMLRCNASSAPAVPAATHGETVRFSDDGSRRATPTPRAR